MSILLDLKAFKALLFYQCNWLFRIKLTVPNNGPIEYNTLYTANGKCIYIVQFSKEYHINNFSIRPNMVAYWFSQNVTDELKMYHYIDHTSYHKNVWKIIYNIKKMYMTFHFAQSHRWHIQ